MKSPVMRLAKTIAQAAARIGPLLFGETHLARWTNMLDSMSNVETPTLTKDSTMLSLESIKLGSMRPLES
jgi:hypothetical protein